MKRTNTILSSRAARATLASAALAALPAILAGPALAQTDTWDGGGADDNWTTGANWLDNTAPPPDNTGGNVLLFGSTATRLTPTVDVDYLVNRINFNQTPNYSLQGSNGSTLSIAGLSNVGIASLGTGTAAAPFVSTTAASLPITATGAWEFQVNTNNVLNVLGDFSTTFASGKNANSGVLVLGGNNSFGGGFTFRGPAGSAIGLASNGALGQAGQTVTNDTGSAQLIYNVQGGGTRTINSNLALGNGNSNAGVLQFGLNDTGSVPSLTSNGGSNQQININGNITQVLGQATPAPTIPDGNRVDIRALQTVQVNGTISGAGVFQKVGAGTLILNNTNTGLTGGFELFAGNTLARTDGAFGTGPILAREGGVILIPGNGDRTFTNSVTLGGTAGGTNNLFQVGLATGDDATFTGPVTLTRIGATSGITGGTANTKPISVLPAGATATFTNAIGQDAAGFGIEKFGPGTLVLGGTNTYTGPTVVRAGTLIVNGDNGGSDASVGAGTLGGGGTVRVLSVFDNTPDDDTPAGAGGVVSPGTEGVGDGVGTLAARRIDLGEGGTYRFTLNDAMQAAGVGSDLIDLMENATDSAVGTVTVSAGTGGFTIDVVGDGNRFDGSTASSFLLIDGSSQTSFASSDFVVTSAGFEADLMGGTFGVEGVGGDISLVFTPVPEPTALALVGLAGLGLLRRRR